MISYDAGLFIYPPEGRALTNQDLRQAVDKIVHSESGDCEREIDYAEFFTRVAAKAGGESLLALGDRNERTALCVSKSQQFAVTGTLVQTLPWTTPHEPTQAVRFCIMAP